MEKLKQNPIVKKLGLNRILLACILVLMFVVFKVVLGSKFPVGDSIKSTLNYVYFLGFLSLGVTFVIATGGIDFSIGPVMFCCALISGYCMTSYHVPCAAAMVICILIGFAFGVFNGWMVSYMSVPPFIISMASMNIAKGIASVFTKTQSVIPHIFKTLIIVELNSQLTCNNGIITYKCITYSINNQHIVSLSAISYFNDLR